MFKTALNKNIIPHTWKLVNIVSIPKPNKDTNKGTSYRPISLLSVIAKTLEKSFLPYITANPPMQHGYKTQHSTVTALHILNNTIAKGFNQMAPPARTITVTLDMSKAFDTINIYILSVYSPFSDRVGLPLHNIHNPSPFTSIMDIFIVDLKFGHIHFYTL